MPRTTAPSTNPRIISGYAPYPKASLSTLRQKGSTTTMEERRQLLVDDPQACDVHPEQVTCTRCSKTVRLQKGKAYHLAHWLDHRWRCDKAVAANPPPRAKSRTLPERKVLLETDPDTRNVEPGRVTCGRCGKDIKFRKGRPYGLSSWLQHKTTCQLTSNLSVISTPATAPPSPAPSEQHTALSSDLLVAALDSHRVRCAHCHSWVEISLQTERDVHVWRRHRESCLSEKHQGDKPGSTRARFFRPQHRLADAADRETGTDASNSPMTDDVPHSTLRPDRNRDSVANGQLEEQEESPASCQSLSIIKKSDDKVIKRLDCASEVSSPGRSRLTSPPPLSFSEATSADTSAACTPTASPRRTFNLPGIRHLPFPEFTPLSPSRFVIDKASHEGEHTVGGALGLRLSGTQLSKEESPSPPGTTNPPPYLERTRLSLPMPSRYWRFDSID